MAELVPLILVISIVLGAAYLIFWRRTPHDDPTEFDIPPRPDPEDAAREIH